MTQPPKPQTSPDVNTININLVFTAKTLASSFAEKVWHAPMNCA
ncbi:MAG: hypothetical protein WBW61_06735 [Rhodanobacteraceae bacterium]